MKRAILYPSSVFSSIAGVAIYAACAQCVAQSLGLEPLVTGIDRPSHAVQAPGDPDSLYVIEQRAGRIAKVDLTSGAMSTVLTFTGFDTTIEGGVHTMAFHPQFEQNGLFYVSWLEDGGAGIGDYGNVDEFQLVGGQGQFSKRILRHQIRDAASTHGLDWVGFDPTASGDEQHYLYITTGDGGFDGANLDNDFSQDLSTLFGKVSRVDVRTDDYPADPDRNFGIPSSNPYANDGDPDTLGEIYLSGFRNPWRMSFDRQTGDIYIGDVGLGGSEEVDFVKAGESGYDFGWNAFEGTIDRGKASLAPDPRFPIHEYPHTNGNVSITGGYVYRGPIEEVQGEYFFGDFNTANVWSGTFDRDTDPATFDGANFAVTSRTDELNDGIVGGGQLNHLVSFGEDLEGNLLFVDYGQGGLFNPTPFTGAVYRLIETVELLEGDLNQDEMVDLVDWAILKTGFLADLTDLNPTERYFTGDLNSDGQINLIDVNLFSAAFDAAHGAGSFVSAGPAIPEPSSVCLLGLVLAVVAGRRATARIRIVVDSVRYDADVSSD
jgi:glucose/arabinose dehydrogenase